MKKLIALLLVLMMTLSFAACGGEEAAEGGDSGEITGEVFDAGAVKALIPKGWAVYPVNDMWSDEANATDPDQMQIVQGGTSEFDTLTKPTITLIHYEPESMMTPTSDFYSEVVNLDPMTTGQLKWEGFSCKDLADEPLIVLWTTDAAGHGYQLNVRYKTSSGSFELTDRDVVAILESIAPSK